MTIGIKEQTGEIIGYKIDGEIINGLYQTTDVSKIHENCENFKIIVEVPQDNRVATHISKQVNIAIVTCMFDTKNKIQFLVGNDMNFEEFKSQSMPEDFKSLIAKAFALINSR